MENYIHQEEFIKQCNQRYLDGISVGMALATLQRLCIIHQQDYDIVAQLIALRKMLGEQIESENQKT